MGKQKYSLELIQITAKANKITCKDKEYRSSKYLMSFNCDCCNINFKRLPSDFIKNHNCPNCELLHNNEIIIDNYQTILSKSNLILIYDKTKPCIITNHSKFNIMCDICGDISYKKLLSITEYYKCINCYNIKMFNEARALATKKDGYFLSSNFRSVLTLYLWQCKKGHIWITDFRSIKDGGWCPYCSFKFGCIQEMQEIAAERGGKCLSDKYIDSFTELLWECAEHHIFQAPPYKIKNHNYWCKECEDKSTSLGERILKCHFEQIFNKQFIRKRHDWLKNSNGYKMELDGYNQELMLAFEHNGPQHEMIVTKFKMTEDDLLKRKIDDQLKIDLCKENNIKLIVIDYISNRQDILQLKNILKEKLLEQNVTIPAEYDSMVIDLSPAFKSNQKEEYRILQEIAASKEGEVISNEYISPYDYMEFKCKYGHIFISTAAYVKCGSWCNHPDCSNNAKNTIEKINKVIADINLECIEENYQNRRQRIRFLCKICGGIFERPFSYILRYRYCPFCHKNNKTNINDITSIT